MSTSLSSPSLSNSVSTPADSGPGKSGFLVSNFPDTPYSTWGAIALLAVLVALLYAHVGAKLVHDWLSIPDYSHGLLIPFFVLFLLWDKRHTLLATVRRPSWTGLPLVVFAVFVMLTGVFGADLFLSRFSFVLLTAGVVWTLLGKRMLGKWAFILFVLVLSIPLPALVLNHITFPLQLFASQLSSSLLPLAGVPVLREGNIITLPAMPLEVAEACSGNPFADESVYGGGHLWLPDGKAHADPRSAGARQSSHRGVRECRQDLRNRPLRAVLGSGQSAGLLP